MGGPELTRAVKTRTPRGRSLGSEAASGREPIVESLSRGDYSGVKAALAADPAPLRRAWPALEPLQRSAAFKLLGPAEALAFYRECSAEDRYFLLGGFDLGAIAPLLEALPASRRALFHRLPPAMRAEMGRLA